MVTSEIIRDLAKQMNISQVLAKKLVTQHIKNISDQLLEGNSVILRGFGSFNLKSTPEQVRKLPFDNQYHTIQAKTTVKFKAAQALKNALNSEDV